jgi:spore coat polysaccharide biosynthesis protein SpsF
MKVRALIQARMGSTRLKGKSLMHVAGTPLLKRVINSLARLRFVDEVMVATTELDEDDSIVEFAMREGVKTFRGSVLDVLERFVKGSEDLDVDDCIVRVTADNPFNNHEISTKVFELHRKNENDYTYIHGLSHTVNEFVSVRALRLVHTNWQLDEFDREHVSPFFRKNGMAFKVQELPSNFLGLRPDLDKLLTIDTIGDLNRIQHMATKINIDSRLNFQEVYKWLEDNK